MTTKYIAAIAAVLVTAGTALAHTGAKGIVMERMETMKKVAAQMKIIGPMVNGANPLDHDAVAAAASVIAGHAEEIPELFPEGSIHGPSEATPAIWEDWDEFVEHAEAMNEQAAVLRELALETASADELSMGFKGVARTCGGCHEDFRLKKQ